jgi:hypothetical protein
MALWILYIHYVLPQCVSAALYSHHQVVLQMHKKEVCCIGRDLPFTNSEYSILVTWLFQIVE